MKVAFKLPIGIGLAGLLFMSSCSKEDYQTPSPEAEKTGAASSLKELTQNAGGGIQVLPSFPTTIGQAGISTYAQQWQRNVLVQDNPQTLPAGNSTFTHLWGNINFPWIKSLPAIPLATTPATIATVSTNSNSWDSDGKKSSVKTKIRHLKPGKKYAITFHVATTKFAGQLLPFTPAYAKSVVIATTTSTGMLGTYVDLTGKEAVWVEKTINFIAEGTEMGFSFQAITANPGEYAYANVFVDKNAIKEVN